MLCDRNLTEHFTLYELTKTSWPNYQEENRTLTEEQVKKLITLAKLLEHVRFVLGEPLIVHSGYRCPSLNRAVGSTDRSQHLLCEAADIRPKDADLTWAFQKLWRDVKDNGANVGQLIHEKANRPYGQAEWIHISLGTPYRDKERCAQILRMSDGVYTRLA